jgi:pullulanase
MGATVNGSDQANQSNIGKIEKVEDSAGSVAVFNDAIRDGLKGSVFDPLSQGYINGAYAANATKVKFGIAGGSISGATWRVPGAAVINYMSAHDNNTLWDKLAMANASNSLEERLAMNRLGAAIVMISQGTPFWQAGEEMLRTKVKEDGTFDENSYQSSDAINNIAWAALKPGTDEHEMMLYYKGLIAMRKAYGIFRGAEDVNITFKNISGGGMEVLFEGADGAKALVVINPTASTAYHTLKEAWNLVADGNRAGADVLGQENGSITLDPYSIRVYVG